MFINIKFKIHIFYKPAYSLSTLTNILNKIKYFLIIFFNFLFFYYTGWNTNTSQYSRNRPVQLGIFSSTFWRSINTNLMPSMVYFLKTVGADTILTFLINIIIFFFFFKKQTHTHTQGREKRVLIQKHTTNTTQKSY